MLSWTRRISIHAPRTGSDMETYMSLITRSNFNPRSPHGERPGGRYKIRAPDNFNPRSPHGERLDCQGKRVYRSQFQSTLPARGATAWTAGMLSWTRRISIHAPRTGSDLSRQSNRRKNEAFQSTLPARGATFVAVFRERGDLISIHAPRTGSDQSATRRAGAGAYFNPRSPHGERLDILRVRNRRPDNFNPRSPHGERRWRYFARNVQ